MANKGKRMLFEDEYRYLDKVIETYPDPTDIGGSGGSNIEAGTGITITTESDDTKVISLDTTPSTFEVTADTGMTLEVENQNPLYKDSKLQMSYTGATRLEGATIDIEANNVYLHSNSAPYYVNNTSHEYKTLATTDQLFSGNYNDLYNKPTIPDAVSGTNDGTNWTSLTIGEDTYGLASGGSTYTAGTGIDITDDTISVDDTVAMKTDIPSTSNFVTTNTTQLITGAKTFINSDGIQSRSTFTSSNRAILNGYSTTPFLQLQRGGGYPDNLMVNPHQISYIPGNSSSNEDFKIITHYPGMNNKAFTYIFKAPVYADTSKTYTVATTDDITTVSGTNDGTNWTTLTIGSDTYGLASGGSGSVDIDNKTIIKNSNDELETAAGGWKEVDSIITDITIPAVTVDWDLVDSTLAANLYGALEANTRYDVELEISGSNGMDTDTRTIEYAYIESTSKTATKFGGNNTLHFKFTDSSTVSNVEFYVDKSSNKIHIYGISIATAKVGYIKITFTPAVETIIYHTIDTNYIPDLSSKYITKDQNDYVDGNKTFNQTTMFSKVIDITNGYGTIGHDFGGINSLNPSRGIRINDNSPADGSITSGGFVTGVKLNATHNPELNGGSSGGVKVYCGTGKINEGPQYCYYMDNTSLYYVKHSNQTNGANLGTSAHLFHDLYLDGNITDGTNTVSVADLAALIAYAKSQGWIS